MTTDTYSYTGNIQSWTVPNNIVSPIRVRLFSGGNSNTAGAVEGLLDVVPGDVLNIYVGGDPGPAPTGSTGAAGGFNGGGKGGDATASGGVGGLGGYGATDIRKNGTALTDRVAVAGGPGGNGRNGSGGQAGGTGGSGGSGNLQSGASSAGTNGAGTSAGTNGIGGSGATNTTPGSGGATNGQAGSSGTGGPGGGTTTAASGRGGGGGGGGYNGGGGGGASSVNTGSGGGGGGSTSYSGLTSVSAPTAAWPGSSVAVIYQLAPNAPTLNSPANNTTLDRTIVQRFAWMFSDPEAGDSQSKYDIRFSADNGATWTTYTNSSPNNYHDLQAGALAAGAWQWQVRTYDSQGNVGPWSASNFFTAATPPNAPTITSPTSGGTVSGDPFTVTWSTPNQTSYQLQRVADNGGSIDTSTVYFDSNETASTSARSLSVAFPVNARYEWLRLRVKNAGLWSTWTQIRVLVSYTPPPAATGRTATVDNVQGIIDVAWTSPAPTGSQPPVTSVSVWRSRDGGITSERVATGQGATGFWRFWTPASGVSYFFAIQTLADNGTSTTSSWFA